MAKHLFYFLMLCLGVLGAIGGIGYCICYHEYHTAVGVAALACMAFPKWNEYRKKLMNE